MTRIINLIKLKRFLIVATTLIFILSSWLIFIARGHKKAEGQSSTTHNGVAAQTLTFEKVGGYLTAANAYPVVVAEKLYPSQTGSIISSTLLPTTNMPNSSATYVVICTIDTNSTTAGLLSGVSISWKNPEGNTVSFQMATGGAISPTPTTFSYLSPVLFRAGNAANITATTVLISGSLNYNLACQVEALD